DGGRRARTGDGMAGVPPCGLRLSGEADEAASAGRQQELPRPRPGGGGGGRLPRVRAGAPASNDRGIMKKKVGIVGAGLQGRRRAPAILEDPDWEIEQVIDLEESRARNLAAPIGAKVGTDWRAVTSNRDVEVVLVLTYPDSHATISLAAMEAG